MIRQLISLTILITSQATIAETPPVTDPESGDPAFGFDAGDEFSEDWGWEEPLMFDEEIPAILTASRLKQPRNEVPASVTVITAEQIRLWGPRTLPELMRYVPGMFVGHADDENNASVAYHTANPSIMRRLQVLIDGRSVYKAAIANVIWDDIPLAIEDIARIEVTRGPNAALYGANSFNGIINIVTKHPADSLGSTVSVRKGNKGIQDIYLSHGMELGSSSLRISAGVNADEGFDGRDSLSGDAKEDELRDGRRHGYFNAYVSHQFGDADILDIQLGYKNGKTEMRVLDFYQGPPDKDTENGYALARWKHDISADHQIHVQGYWQKEDRQQDLQACVPTLSLDPALATLYLDNPDWANVVGLNIPLGFDSSVEIQGAVAAIQNNLITPEALSVAVSGLIEKPVTITQAQFDLAQTALTRPDIDLTQFSCGDSDLDLGEQRIDIEIQDTKRWNDYIRTVSGISFRQDAAYSDTYFKGEVRNNTWRLFSNGEFRVGDHVIFNLGGMYEKESQNLDAFSPRAAVNFLFSNKQSTRIVFSQAVRSPDILESEPDFTFEVKNLRTPQGGINYLGLDRASFFQQQVVDDEQDLTHEKITSYEIGHYISFGGMEFDLKLFREEMKDLISEPISLSSRDISNSNSVTVNGGEFQLSGNLNENNRLWITYSVLEVDADYTGDELIGEAREDVERVERLLSAQNSLVTSWTYQGESWHSTISHFFQDTRHLRRNYERLEWNIAKTFRVSGVDLELSYHIQHNLETDEPLNYRNQIYSTPNIYYGQLRVEF